MSNISSFVESNLKTTKQNKHPQYLARTLNLKGNLAVRTYLTRYPLFSSKYLDYLVWDKVLIKMVKIEHKNADLILKLKESMYSKRTYFNWKLNVLLNYLYYSNVFLFLFIFLLLRYGPIQCVSIGVPT